MIYEPRFTEDEVAVIQQALNFYCDMNQHLTQEQFEAAQGALIAIEDSL